MKKPPPTKKPVIPSGKDQACSAVDAAVIHRQKNRLPISPAAEVALQKAVCFLHPSHGQGLTLEEYHEVGSLILEQACLAILNHPATSALSYEKKKGRKKRMMFHSSIANDCWPPAFDLRSETDDERFARVMLASC